MALFNPSRHQVRQFFFDTWAKFSQGTVLSGLESLALQIIHMHPEYHPILDAPDRFQTQEYFPEMGETNPFLHMSLHLSILEQLSINQPVGIVDAYQSRLKQSGDPHVAQHVLMDCLAEALWRAQRHGGGPDAAFYLECMNKQ